MTGADLAADPPERHWISTLATGDGSRRMAGLWELGAGITVACLALPLCISAGVLVYSQLGPTYAAKGAIAGLLCAVAGGIVASIFGRSSFVTTIPTMPLAVMLASFVAAMAASWPGRPGIVIASLPVLVLAIGAWQILFATTGLSRVIKFTPYPVLAGFVSGIGVLIILQQFPVLAGHRSVAGMWADILAFHWSHPSTTLFGFGLVALMLTLESISSRIPGLLVGLVAGYLIFHLLSWYFPGIDLGATIGDMSFGSIWVASPLEPDSAAALLKDAASLKLLIFNSLALATLATLEAFFTLRAAQQLAEITPAPRRDLIGQGAANLASALAGGLAVATSIKLSVANFYAGGRSRISAIVASLVLLFAIGFVPRLIFSLPLVVLASILVVASLRLLDPWIARTLREAVAREGKDRFRAILNLLIVAVVLSATAFEAPVAGAAVGFGLSCLIFIAQMSRPVVARRLSGAYVRSKRIRCLSHVELLRLRGERITILELEGALFFGNADDLAAELRALVADNEVVLLDIRKVSDIDASGIAALEQVAQRFAEKGKVLIACGPNANMSERFQSVLGKGEKLLFVDRDAALEWAEEKIISGQAQEREVLDVALHDADLTQKMSRDDVRVLAEGLKLVPYPAGAVLCCADDPGDCMWILKRGSVSIRLPGKDASARLASLGPGCSVGEMALLEKKARSADVVADEDVEAYLLTEASFADILREHPSVGQAFLVNIARQLSQHLRDTSQELQSLTN
jgi:MFS superfamily sulfate permease-like transporter